MTPKKHLDVERVAEEIRNHRGNMAAVARAFGVRRQAVWKFITQNPYLKEICDESKETMLDVAEDKLREAVEAGEGWAVCFYLKTQGKARGYIQTVAVEREKKKPRFTRNDQ